MIEEFRNMHSHHHHHHHHRQETHSQNNVQLNDQGLIVPKKLFNPCMESKEVQDLNKEIKWNAKTGINVLGNKSELAKAMERRKLQQIETEKRLESEACKTDFQKVLEERAKRINELEKRRRSDEDGDSGHSSPEPESEFLKVHALLKSKTG